MAGTRPLKDDEVEEVLGFLSSARDRALFILGLRTGYRISELLSLKIGDVARNGRLRDRIVVRRARMKAKRQGRAIILHPEAKQALQDLLDELGPQDPDAPVFQSRKGTDRPITRRQAQRIFRRAFEAVGLDGPLGTHSCRKTFAQRVHERLGRDLFKTQKALGHSSIQSTIHYLTVDQDELDEAILTA